MNNSLNKIIQSIGKTYKNEISGNDKNSARHYLEVSLGKQADKLGVSDIPDKIRAARAIVPLKNPVSGMKVRIDGRTFVDYARFDSGVAVPGYVARAANLPFGTYIPEDSMILNFA